MKKKIIIGLLILILGYFIYGFYSTPSISNSRIENVKEYCKRHNMNTNIAVFVDFDIHSGKQRFMVYDFNKKKIILASLCAHGCGKESTKSEPVFSNDFNSYCSSIGYFKIGNYNETGLGLPSYLLDGLSLTNYNARKRQLLIHPYYTIRETQIYPFYTPMDSEGCFVINSLKFKLLQNIIKVSNKPILLYAYCQIDSNNQGLLTFYSQSRTV